MRICYVRHGEELNNNLTHLGKKQAKMVALQLKEEDAVKIYCSPANRCLETATIIAKKLNLNIEVVKELDERFKIKNPTTKEELLCNDNYLNYNFKLDSNLPTCKDFIDRNFKAFNLIINNHLSKNENVIIVAHSSTIYALNAYICGIPKDGYINWIRAGNCAKICYEKELPIR